MTIGLTELHPQHMPEETLTLSKYAKRILDITPICFTKENNETESVRLYYSVAPTGGHYVAIERCHKGGHYGNAVEVSLPICNGEAEAFLKPDAKDLGFTLKGLCKMLERLSPFSKHDLTHPE